MIPQILGQFLPAGVEGSPDGDKLLHLYVHEQGEKPRLPITIHMLAGIHAALAGSRDHDSILLWAIAASAFFGFFSTWGSCYGPLPAVTTQRPLYPGVISQWIPEQPRQW